MTDDPNVRVIYTSSTKADEDAILAFIEQVSALINVVKTPQRIYGPGLMVLAASAVSDAVMSDEEIIEEFRKCLRQAREEAETVQ